MTINVSVTDINRPQNSAVMASELQDYSDNEIFMMNIPNPGGDSVSSVAVGTAGTYTTLIPLVSFTSTTGAGAAAFASMKALTVAVAAPGTGVTPADTYTFTGGTFSTASIVTTSTTQLVSFAPNAAGTGYAPGDVETLIGGTFSQAAQITASTTKVVSATVAAGGSGGTPGTQTVTGTTGTGTKFQASVTVSGGGAITAVLSITVAGSYSVNPTIITNEPVTGAGLTGAALSVVMGFATGTITRPGSYTVNTATFTSSSSGTGSGATFQTGLYGFLTGTVSTPGRYTVLPTAPVAVTGTGTSVTLTPTYGVDIVTVTNGGYDYATPPGVVFSSGAAVATASLSGVDAPVVVGLLFNAPLPSASYDVRLTANQPAVCSAFNKTVAGCSLQLNPVPSGTIVSGLLDAGISFTQ